MSADKEPDKEPLVFLSLTEMAAYLGIRRDTLNRYDLPEPDAYVGDRRGWAKETIDEWNRNRPGRGWWGKRSKDDED